MSNRHQPSSKITLGETTLNCRLLTFFSLQFKCGNLNSISLRFEQGLAAGTALTGLSARPAPRTAPRFPYCVG
jgi:hypothetical protein